MADQEDMMRNFRIIVERYSDGYVGYPLGLKGVVVGQGDTYEEALADVKSAIRFHIETFGKEAFDAEIADERMEGKTKYKGEDVNVIKKGATSLK